MTTSPAAGTDTPRIFRCADLEVDEGRQRVLRNGDEVVLPKLSFDLLLALLDAAPNYLSHRQLMERVWPRLVVGDKTVTQRVKLLRDALGDDSDEPRYIAGLRGRGYRIAPPVTRVAVTPAPGHAASPEMQVQPGSSPAVGRKRFLRRFAAAGAVVGAVLFAVWLSVPPSPPPRDELPAATPAATTTIAVLPFRDPAGDNPDLAFGVPEAVLDALSSAPGLTVIARSSSFRAAGEDRTVQELGSLLGARYLVDGSVQRAGDTLRVSAQLVDADAGTQVWAASFDVRIDEIFGLQDRIAARVAQALDVRIGRDDARRPARPTAAVDAYFSYLRGRALLERWTRADADAAVAAFEAAVELDPGFGAAYAALYDARLMAADRRCARANPAGVSADEACGLDAARAAGRPLIETALALDPGSGAAYFARAIWADDSPDARDADFRRGLALDPSNGRGITAYAEFLDRTGRSAEAAEMLERAIRVDPLSPRAYFWRVTRAAEPDARTLEDGMLGVLEIDPDYVPALQRYAKYRWILHGELAQAIGLIEHALARDPDSPWLRHTAIAMYLDVGDVDAARELEAGAGSPVATGRILLSLYDGDARAAAEAALGGLGFTAGNYENWGVYEALRERAVSTGAYADALDYLDRHMTLGAHAAEITIENFRAVPAYAQLLIMADRPDAARALLGRCVRWIDEVHLPRMGGVYALRIKAEALLMLGDTDAALDALAASFAARDFVQWWYTIDRDPLWAAVRDGPRFVAIAAGVRRHVDAEQQALDALRARGKVPRRGAKRGAGTERLP